MFGSYLFNLWPPDYIGKPQESGTMAPCRENSNATKNSGRRTTDYIDYRRFVFRVNVRERVRSPERIGHVQLGGMIGTDRLWLDRSCANFYGICIYPGLAEDGSVTREGASKRCFRRDWAFGPEDGPVRLLRLIRHKNTVQRMDMALAGEPIKIGEWETCTSDYRWHFHFMSDNEAILLVGESEIDAVTQLRLFLRTHVYHLHIDTVGSRGPSPRIQGRGQFGADGCFVCKACTSESDQKRRSIAFATKIDFPVPIEQPDNLRVHHASCPVGHSDQIFLYLMEETAATNNDKHQKQKMLPLFYKVDMQHKCLFYNDVNSSWERWDDDTSADSPIPPGKYYFQRDRFDKGLLLLNYLENCYVQLQIRPLERRCADLASEIAFFLEANSAFGQKKSNRFQQLQ
uniref:ApeC domain-containing protein n=1 Tax=Globodera pallida TaxID=36090 RepID=A0A183BKJ3_GLOPA